MPVTSLADREIGAGRSSMSLLSDSSSELTRSRDRSIKVDTFYI